MSSERVRIVRRAVHGVLLLDKPAGMSSNDALQKAKRLYRAEKAGHTGTLDPLATGLLPLCFGAATKFSQASLDADKAYRATLALGRTTSTGDAEGGIVRERSVEVTAGQIDAVCRRFVGEQMQVPPMHSALKVGGRALYRLAREGREVERVPRAIRIDAIEVVEWQAERLVIDVRCSKGSYIRTLGEDIGEALGCGAHLAALRRTARRSLRSTRRRATRCCCRPTRCLPTRRCCGSAPTTPGASSPACAGASTPPTRSAFASTGPSAALSSAARASRAAS